MADHITVLDAFALAFAHHQAGRLSDAERLYRSILDAQPQHADANHNTGVLAVQVGKPAVSLPYFKAALEADPSQGQFWLSYIDALLQAGQHGGALQILDQGRQGGLAGPAVEALAVRADALAREDVSFSLVVAHQNVGRLDEAEKCYRQFLALNPLNVSALVNLGSTLFALGRLVEAEAFFRRALDIQPDNIPAHYNLALSLRKMGRLVEAEASYRSALNINPNFADAHSSLSAVLRELGRSKEAEASSRRALEINPGSFEAHSTLASALHVCGRLKEAEASYRHVLVINPNDAETHSNLGNSLHDLGQLVEAEVCCRRALELRPNFAAAHYNLGNTLRELGRLEESEASFRSALEIMPDYIEAHSNLGNVLCNLGRLEDAEASYFRVFDIDPNHAYTWNNYHHFAVSLWFLETRVDRREDICRAELSPSAFATSDFQMHDYFVNKFKRQETEESFKRAMAALPSQSDEALTMGGKCSEQTPPFHSLNNFSGKTVALLHFGRSGTGLLHSLIDSHPEVSTIPSVYLRGLFNAGVWRAITADGWSKLPLRFANMFEVLFDSTSPKSIPGILGENSSFVGRAEGMTNVGVGRDEALFVKVEKFCSEALGLMNCYSEIDPGLFFRIIHAAYESAVGAKTKKSTIFYHIHNPTDYAFLNFLRYEPETKLLMMIREPVKSCESWISEKFCDNDYFTISTRIILMLFDVDKFAFRMHDSVGVRLEDLKLQPKKTIRALCTWMGIKETPSLYEMTAQGKKWWGDPSSPNYDKNEAMAPFGDNSTVRPLGAVFSESDQFVLQTLFYPFSVRFEYREPDPVWFKESLKAVRLQLEDMMDFEKVLSERMMIDPVKFKLSANYLFLRAGLFARLDVLDEYGDYPHMLRPLDISGY